jgi:hypothetical protein
MAVPTQSEGEGREAVKKAAKGRKLDEHEAQDALEWFLAREGDANSAPEPKRMKLNLGSRENPQPVWWVIGPVEDVRINAIRDAARKGGNRRQRRRSQEEQEVDEMLVARRIVVEATIEPDLGQLAKRMDLVDPADALHAFFAKAGKTGLITQISGEVLTLSGWDDEDIEEVEAARG